MREELNVISGAKAGLMRRDVHFSIPGWEFDKGVADYHGRYETLIERRVEKIET